MDKYSCGLCLRKDTSFCHDCIVEDSPGAKPTNFKAMQMTKNINFEDKPEDVINKPSHYHKNNIDVIGYMEQHFPNKPTVSVAEGFFIGNILKYVSRYKDKNGIEDLKKAEFYLNKLKELELRKG